MKAQIIGKTENGLKIKVKYGNITLKKNDVEKIADDSDPDAVLALARYYVSQEDWEGAIEEFDNLLLIQPEKKEQVLEYLADINFSKSSKERYKDLKSVASANKMIEEGKVLVTLGRKQLDYKTQFEDKSWQNKIRSIARKNIQQGEEMVRKGESIVRQYQAKRQAEIKKAREKAEEEKK
ncbi:hypothetical protein KDK77_10110 [bacterium]|nr:hypothetical protein [bacterium]